MIINLDAIGWKWCIIILIFVLFIIYMFFGGGDYEYVGLAPLEIGYNASHQAPHYSGEDVTEEGDIAGDNVTEEGDIAGDNVTEEDNTPEIPNLDRVKTPPKKPIFINFSESQSYESSRMSYGESMSISESQNEEQDLSSAETLTTPMTPRTAALGPFQCRVNGFISKGERLCKQAIEEIYGKPFFCIRPNFLKNPETGRNLELDIYNDELKIAIEYSGKSHYVFPNSFHKTHQDFINQVRRDKFKVEQCDANGVYLITVPYNVPLNLTDIKKYITCYLPENVQKRTS